MAQYTEKARRGRRGRGRVGLLVAAAGATALGALALLTASASLASVPRCMTANLHATYLDTNGAAGGRGVDVALKNVGSTTCELHAFPGVGLLNSQGHLLASVNVVRATGFPTPVVAVAPGHSGYFTFFYESGGPCIPHTFNAYGLEIYPPNDFTALKLHFGTFNVCNVAGGGKPRVYPMRATPSL